MPILFSTVAYNREIVAKFASCDGNFTEIAEEIIIKVPPKNDKMTYSHGYYLLHYIAENEYFYFCITAKGCQRSRAFLFLNEIKRRFTLKQGKEFKQVLCEEMYRYSEDYNTISIRKGELDELNSIGVGCSESLLGEKSLFVNNPEDLRYSLMAHVGDFSQKPTLIVDAIESKENPQYFKCVPEDLRYRTMTYVEEGTQTVETTEPEKGSSFLFYFLVTVILILIWLASSTWGPISVTIVTCICVFLVINFNRGKNYS